MRLTRNHALLAACTVSLLAACSRHDDSAAQTRPPRPNIVSDIPTLARARQIDTTGTEDADRATWQVEWPFDSVTGYYMHMVPTLGWALHSSEGDSTQRDLYFRKDTLALWMHIERKSPAVTEWTIIGTAATKMPAPPPPEPRPRARP